MKKMAVLLYAAALICVFYALGILLSGAAGTKFYLIWFLIAAFLTGAGLGFQKNLWSLLPVRVRGLLLLLLCAAVIWFLFVEGLILSGFGKKAENGLSHIIVLGAQMKQNGPSVALARRLDAAADYLEENPDTICVVSGGQGSNEPMSEAEGMYHYLVEKGIAPERILKEDRSRNTFQNLAFSRELIPKEVTKVGIVTSNFHVHRATQLAKMHGFSEAEGIGAMSGSYFLYNNLLREFFGVMKDWIFGGMKLF